MIGGVARKLFGSANDRRIRSYRPRVDAINALEKELEQLPDEALRARTEEFKKQLAEGTSLDDILVPAFAMVREAAKRTLGQRHFDVQLVGGMVLHDGGIAEMQTGEGKTLVATLPVYLNALAGKGVHVVTVNDYLANRDAEWMGQIYRFLGLTVGVIVHGLDDERAPARLPLRHHLRHQQRVRLRLPARQPGLRGSRTWCSAPHHFAIVDEVNSILIDEARTPLIISGPTEDRSEFYRTIDTYIPRADQGRLRPRREAAPALSPSTARRRWRRCCARRTLLKSDSLYDVDNVSVVHHVNQALRANVLYQRDRDYIVRDGEVDPDRRVHRPHDARPALSEGLHQAIEAKEGADRSSPRTRRWPRSPSRTTSASTRSSPA